MPQRMRALVPWVVWMQVSGPVGAFAPPEDDSEGAVRQRIAADPKDDASRIELARILTDADRVGEAERELDVCRLAGDDPAVPLAAGLLYHRLHRYRAADRCFARVDAVATLDPMTSQFLGTLDLRAGRLRAARTHFERAVAEAPEWPVPALGLGLLEVRTGHVARGLELLHRVIDSDDPSAEAHLGVADAWLAVGASEPAAVALRAVLNDERAETQELRAEALARLGRLYAGFDLIEPAVACLEAAVMEGEQPRPILDDLARLYARIGREDDAVALLQVAIQMDGRITDRLTLARWLDEQGRADEALVTLRQVAQGKACHPGLLWALSRLEERVGTPERAADAFAALLAMEQQWPRLGHDLNYLWVVAERSLGSKVETIHDDVRGRTFLKRVQARSSDLEQEQLAAFLAAAERDGLPVEVIAASVPDDASR